MQDIEDQCRTVQESIAGQDRIMQDIAGQCRRVHNSPQCSTMHITAEQCWTVLYSHAQRKKLLIFS
jgi:hypothetical protein